MCVPNCEIRTPNRRKLYLKAWDLHYGHQYLRRSRGRRYLPVSIPGKSLGGAVICVYIHHSRGICKLRNLVNAASSVHLRARPGEFALSRSFFKVSHSWSLRLRRRRGGCSAWKPAWRALRLAYFAGAGDNEMPLT